MVTGRRVKARRRRLSASSATGSLEFVQAGVQYKVVRWTAYCNKVLPDVDSYCVLMVKLLHWECGIFARKRADPTEKRPVSNIRL